jgi:histidinol-phosphate/aromatic aminotransferase/cobyric acid decarboxylase-like protein
MVKQRFGLARVIKLASNENPLGTSPKAIEHARCALADMFRYNARGIHYRTVPDDLPDIASAASCALERREFIETSVAACQV